MSALPLSCPRCGGYEVQDLRRIRRGTGNGLVVLGVVALAVLAAPRVAAVPGWSLVLAGDAVDEVGDLIVGGWSQGHEHCAPCGCVSAAGSWDNRAHVS